MHKRGKMSGLKNFNIKKTLIIKVLIAAHFDINMTFGQCLTL